MNKVFARAAKIIDYMVNLGIYEAIIEKKCNSNSLCKQYERFIKSSEYDDLSFNIPTRNTDERKVLDSLTNLIKHSTKGKKLDDDYQVLYDYIIGAKDSFSILYLQKIETVSLVSGYFKLALQFRNIAYDKLLNNYNKKYIKYKYFSQTIWALIHANRINDAKNIMMKINPIQRIIFGKTLELRLVELALREPQLSNQIALNNGKFLEMIQNKIVSIICPANIKLNHALLDKDDIIIRLNFRGDEYILPDQRDISTNISYYGGLGIDTMVRNGDSLQFFDGDFYSVFGLLKHTFQKELCEKGKARSRVVDGLVLYQGWPNLLQATIQDLLMFRPKKIKVLCANLYLSTNKYSDGYKIKGTEQDLDSFLDSYAKHNIISQFEYLHHFYSIKVIEPDDTLRNVLDLGISEYIKQMEEIVFNERKTGE